MWIIYFIDLIAKLRCFIFPIGAFCFVAGLVSLFTFSDTRRKKVYLKAANLFRISSKVFICSMLFNTLVPNEKTMYLMLGAKIGEEVISANQDVVQDVKKIVKLKLEDIIKENTYPNPKETK